jgi:hypothetical protein
MRAKRGMAVSAPMLCLCKPGQERLAARMLLVRSSDDRLTALSGSQCHRRPTLAGSPRAVTGPDSIVGYPTGVIKCQGASKCAPVSGAEKCAIQ